MTAGSHDLALFLRTGVSMSRCLWSLRHLRRNLLFRFLAFEHGLIDQVLLVSESTWAMTGGH